jgi:predicted TIM-barrel fold metal-dependent hydrolase
MDRAFDIFDCHQHMGSTGDAHGTVIPGQVRGARIVAEELETRLRLMDERGVRQALAIPGHNYDRADGIAATRRENDGIAAYRDHRPDRFPVAAGVVEPLDEAAAMAELDRIADELGLRAVSFHTEYQGVTIDSPWVVRLVERMGELGLVPFVHASNVDLHEALWRMAKLARAFPDLTLVAVEPFFTHEGLAMGSFVADVAPNVVFETASCFDTDMLFDLVADVGAQRFVYGSQHYSQVCAPGHERAHTRRSTAVLRDILETPRLGDDDKARILGGNARRILGVTG